MELTVTLDFCCCGCTEPLAVTVQCSGKGLANATQPLPAVHVACPYCGLTNRLVFEPSGQVRSVKPYPVVRPLPEPSLN
jgi:hypothetical protein